MLWKKPTTLYEDSFESSPDTPLIPIDTNLASTTSRSTAPTASSSNVSRTANTTGTDSFCQPPRTSSSSVSNNEGRKVKKERFSMPFFNARKKKERTRTSPLLEQSKNQKAVELGQPKHILASKALDTNENIDPDDDAARPDPPAKTPPASPITTKYLFQEAILWNDDEEMHCISPDVDWNFAEPTTMTGAAGAGLSVSFPDSGGFLHGMEMNSSVNVTDALNTTGFPSSFVAYPEDKIINDLEKLVEQNDSNEQQDKSAIELSEEAKSALASTQQDKTAVHMTMGESFIEESINDDEKRTNDMDQEEKLTNGTKKYSSDKPTNDMETNSSDNLVDALNTTDLSSSIFACPKDEIDSGPEKLAEDDVSQRQQDISAIELSEEEKSADVSKQQDKPTVHSDKDGKLTAESINEEKRDDDPNQEDKAIDGMERNSSDNLVDALNTTCSSFSFFAYLEDQIIIAPEKFVEHDTSKQQQDMSAIGFSEEGKSAVVSKQQNNSGVHSDKDGNIEALIYEEKRADDLNQEDKPNNGMQKHSSVNLADALSTTCSSSSFFAYLEDQIIIPEKLVDQDISKQQQDKSAVDLREEAKSADVWKQQYKSDVHSNKDGKLTEESINEERPEDDQNQDDKAIHGMEKISSVNLADTLSTTGSSSSSFAYPEDKIVIPVKVVKHDVSKQQHDKPGVEFSEESKSADVSKQQDNHILHSNNDGKLTEESFNEERPEVDSNQVDKPTNGVALVRGVRAHQSKSLAFGIQGLINRLETNKGTLSALNRGDVWSKRDKPEVDSNQKVKSCTVPSEKSKPADNGILDRGDHHVRDENGQHNQELTSNNGSLHVVAIVRDSRVHQSTLAASGVQGLINRLQTNKGTLSALNPADDSSKRDKPVVKSDQEDKSTTFPNEKSKPADNRIIYRYRGGHHVRDENDQQNQELTSNNDSLHVVALVRESRAHQSSRAASGVQGLINRLETNTGNQKVALDPADDSSKRDKPEVDSKQQEDKSAVESSEEENPADVSAQQYKTAVQSNKDGNIEAMINEEKRADDFPGKEDKPADDSIKVDNPEVDSNQEDEPVADLNQEDALDQLVAEAKATTEKALVAAATEIAVVSTVPSNSKTLEKQKQTPVESPGFKMHATIKNVPGETPPASEAESSSDGGSGEEVIGERSLSESLRSQIGTSESDEERESHSHYHEGVRERSNLSDTEVVNEDYFVDESYDSVDISVLSLTGILQDDLASVFSGLTPVLGTGIAEAATEEPGPIYSLCTYVESTISEAAEVMSFKVFPDFAAFLLAMENASVNLIDALNTTDIVSEADIASEATLTEITSTPAGKNEIEKDQDLRRREKKDQNRRRNEVYKWYKHYAKPTKENMCQIVDSMNDTDIAREDVDLLPWNLKETRVVKEHKNQEK